MRSLCLAIVLSVSALVALPTLADHHGSHHTHGPNGGVVKALGASGYSVELSVASGTTVTARVLDKDMKPVAIDAAKLILTFTEPDGEKEDYEIGRADSGEAGVFEKKSGHVVNHITRDKIAIKLNVGGGVQESETFAYPHGPNGGDLIALGKSKFQAELIVDGDVVRVHLLNKRKRPVAVDAKEITFTFTEPDGELEDYTIPAAESSSKGSVFERNDDHVVMHVKRDKISIKLANGEKTLSSKTFKYSEK
ncbi:MAG: hypothetical protein AAF664_15760 [Planctomycetota bacterium]